MVKHIKTSEDKDIPFCISYSAISLWSNETKLKMEELDENLDMQSLEPLFYYSLLAGYRQKREKCPYMDRKSDEYVMMLDDLFFVWLKTMPDFFQGLNKN